VPASAEASTAAELPPPPPPSAPAVAPPAKPAGPALQGHAEKGAVRITVYNDSSTPWTDCELSLKDGRYYKLGDLGANSDDAVMTVKFSKPAAPPKPAMDHVVVKCDEGEAKFAFATPAGSGPLKGYAESDGSRVTVHNTGDTTWNRCDVRKPDGTHFVMGKLEARDQNSIRGGAFNKDAEPEIPITSLFVRCKQGSGEFPFR
jgi:hypothetical protein